MRLLHELPCGKGDEVDQTVGDIIQGKNLGSGMKFCCRLRHPVHYAASGVLGYGERSRVTHGSKALSPVSSHTREKDTSRFAPPMTNHAFKEDINGWAIEA